jgi:hypothetical protein
VEVEFILSVSLLVWEVSLLNNLLALVDRMSWSEEEDDGWVWR